MEAVKLAGFSVAAALLALTLKRQQPQLGTALSMAAGAMLLIFAVQRLGETAQAVIRLAQKVSLGSDTVKMLVKVMGISYLAEFAFQTCREAGEEGLGQKVLLAGKVMIMGLAMPMAASLVEMILALAP